MLWVLAGLLVIVLGALLWVVLRARSGPPDAPTNSRRPAPTRPLPARGPTTWGKTVVVPDPANACLAALRLEGQSFATEAAPRLPLANCTMVDQCQCHYVPAQDRRQGRERRSGVDRRTHLRFEPGKEGDRRKGKDRRHRNTYDWDNTV